MRAWAFIALVAIAITAFLGECDLRRGAMLKQQQQQQRETGR